MRIRYTEYNIMLMDDLKTEEYHEIINSVGVIKNLAELLLEEEVEPSKRDMLSRIMARSEKIVELMR